MKLYRTKSAILVFHEGKGFKTSGSWDALINRSELHSYLLNEIRHFEKLAGSEDDSIRESLAPIGSQEVWAAGITYSRSKEARMDESKDSGGATFYDKVYEAERPELFFKALPQRVVGSGEEVYIRRDSTWNVPEPELTLYINSLGDIVGYTIGNDMSSRSIEGENPLYLPQAKTYDRSAALGPCLYVPSSPISPETTITMEISRAGRGMYKDSIPISRMKRSHRELADYLFRECTFPHGVFLMTGTCIVPPNDFTLARGDVVTISIDGIGRLINSIGLRA
jgi:2-dehydro-3-deoxy-D-arabinonate dehydratase